ncbi:MAG: hypothetical protein H6920_09305 [Sphingomonadaceae bacterium]|nr:hypothetical protein [Sphingomonadaceae bacterium]MCP5391804.1 hypothetical protein [Sphingomonadaceae bacterium]
MIRQRQKPGQPLIVLATVLAVWVVGRIALWQSPFPASDAWPELLFGDVAIPAFPMAERQPVAQQLPVPSRSAFQTADIPNDWLSTQLQELNGDTRSVPVANVEVLAGHQLMWMAAMSRVPVPAEVAGLMRIATPVDRLDGQRHLVDGQGGQAKDVDRWGFDAWVLYRPNSTGGLQGVRPASYGASQAGAVINYRLDPGNSREPRLYLRGTRAFARPRETEAAFGLSVRPLPKVPLRAQAELRLQHAGGRNEWRPAVLGVSEIDPVKLPLNGRADVYLQAGYVGGDFATPFVDGQARLTGRVTRTDDAWVDAGVGVWGGAQKGAARLDLGPTAGVGLKLGDVPARLSVDYRQRVAGDAAPQSGIAVTLSTSF